MPENDFDLAANRDCDCAAKTIRVIVDNETNEIVGLPHAILYRFADVVFDEGDLEAQNGQYYYDFGDPDQKATRVTVNVTFESGSSTSKEVSIYKCP